MLVLWGEGLPKSKYLCLDAAKLSTPVFIEKANQRAFTRIYNNKVTDDTNPNWGNSEIKLTFQINALHF